MENKVKILFGVLLFLVLPVTGVVYGEKIPVIYDSDIGDDIDDTWAISFLLRCPELDLRLVVGDYGKNTYRARLFARILAEAGRSDVPIGIGMDQDNGQTGNQSEWLGEYNLESYPGEVYEDGVQAIIYTIMKSEEQVTLLCVGPVPNIAEALKREPQIAKKSRFVGMYGSVYAGYGGSSEISAEYNVRADVKSCQAVLSAGWDVTITPLDTCGRVQLKSEKYQKVAGASDPVAKMVIDNYKVWIKHADWMREKHGLDGSKSSILFDTVAVYLCFSDDLLVMEDLNIRVDDEGYTRLDKSGKKMSVAVKWKDMGKFEDMLVSRLIAEKDKNSN